MIICIEGCDCSGKDTLANALAEKTGYEIVRGSSFEIAEKGTDYMYQHMMDLLDRDNIIINRFYMSNYVYGNLFNKNTMSDDQFARLSNKANKRALTIYTTSSLRTLKERMKRRGDDDISIEDLSRILNKYSEAIRNPLLTQKLIMQVYTEYVNSIPLLASAITSLIVDVDEPRIFIKHD